MNDATAQSLRAVGGSAFELVVARILNTFLEQDDIVITRAKPQSLRLLIGDPANIMQVMDYTRVPIKRKCDQRQLPDYPDLDLFALIRPSHKGSLWRLLAIINCKVSFHGRHTEATFWGLLVRLTSDIRFVVVTEDRDIYVEGGRSELGRSCVESTVTRRLLEAFSDRVYLVKRYQNENDPRLMLDIATKQDSLASGVNQILFDDPDIPHHTQYCHSVRPIDALIDELRRWKVEIPE